METNQLIGKLEIVSSELINLLTSFDLPNVDNSKKIKFTVAVYKMLALNDELAKIINE